MTNSSFKGQKVQPTYTYIFHAKMLSVPCESNIQLSVILVRPITPYFSISIIGIALELIMNNVERENT